MATKKADAGASTRTKRGRPKVLSVDMSERIMIRATLDDKETWTARASAEGFTHRGKGLPGTLIRKVLNAYENDPAVRAAVADYVNWLSEQG